MEDFCPGLKHDHVVEMKDDRQRCKKNATSMAMIVRRRWRVQNCKKLTIEVH
jgi:hypothetical protein